MKEFFIDIHCLPIGLSLKLTNQVACFTQSANGSKAEFVHSVLLLACCVDRAT